MAVNINTILEILLDKRLGLTEYKLNYLYPEIHKLLLTYTLPIFSQYFPCYRRYSFLPSAHKTDVEYEYYLNLPEIVENKLNIISVANVVPKSGLEAPTFMDSYRPFGMTIEDVISNSLSTNIASRASYSYKNYKFIAPNRIKLRGFGNYELYIMLKINYPSFSSIPDSVIEQFLDLAEADIKIYIYNKLKHYDQLNVPTANIDLKLDLFASGVQDREAIIQRFGTKGYPNTSLNRVYTYE